MRLTLTSTPKVVKGLGRTAARPAVHIMVPPSLMQQGAYGMNQTVIIATPWR